MTATRLLTPNAALASVAQSLRLPTDIAFDCLLGQALRRASYQLAPCARHILERSVAASFLHIAPSDVTLNELVPEVLDTLIAYGEILELRPLAEDQASTTLVLRPSPAFFVRHHSGSAILIGVAADDITPLSPEANARVRYQGLLRLIDPRDNENLYELLSDGGIPELPSATWFRVPPQETAAAYVAKWTERLHVTSAPSAVEGLTIYEGGGSDFYPKRRVPPRKGHSGVFVGRRSQKYGADLWCLVDLTKGLPFHLLDLTSEGDRLRPVDVAWRILMALDYISGQPQRFRIRKDGETSFLDFFTPIPGWARRRIAIDGTLRTPHKCLLTYEVSTAYVDDVTPILTNRLWLDSWASCIDEGQ